MTTMEEITKYGRHFGTNLFGEQEAETSVKRKRANPKKIQDTKVKILHRGRVSKGLPSALKGVKAADRAPGYLKSPSYTHRRLVAHEHGKEAAALNAHPNGSKYWVGRYRNQGEAEKRQIKGMLGIKQFQLEGSDPSKHGTYVVKPHRKKPMPERKNWQGFEGKDAWRKYA